MITIADLNDLRAHPRVAYDGYDELRAAARRRNGGLADPREIPLLEAVMRNRGRDWCTAVLGYPVTGGLRTISSLDADMLMIADERQLNPPLPGWLVQWRKESDETRRQQDEVRGRAVQRDQARWTTALATCGVRVEVRPNVHGRRTNTVLRGPLRHVVPAEAARSPRRRHLAGRALCESAGRAKPLLLGEPTADPATCTSCVAYTAVIQPARSES